MLLVALGLTPSALGADAVTEVELVRRYLQGPVAIADLDVVDAQTRAEGTVVSLVDNPTLQARHEAARGEWGATTDAIGAAATVDLGLSPLARSRAARLRASAGPPRRRLLLLDATCMVRADAIELWAASRAADVSEGSQERLDQLLETLGALADAGEASGYERDRTALAVAAHQTRTADRVGTAESLRARVSARVGGEPVVEVALGELGELPSLDASLADLGTHPWLAALTVEQQAAAAERDAARRDQIPDLTVSGGPRWDAAPTGGPASPGFEVAGAVQVPWTDGSRARARHQTAEHVAAEARLTRASAELQAEVHSAHRRVETLSAAPALQTDPEAVWTAALDRYSAGEASLDDLLQVADAVEAARLARVERERLQRRARLDLSCAVGRFSDPALQSLLEEAAR